MGKILVIGSTNMDIIAMVDHLPVPGETVGNAVLARAHGGKGANQAVAAARAGGEVTFITCVGEDDDGKKMLEGFREDGIYIDHIKLIPGVPTGTALILVDRNGENSIAVAPGANNHLSNAIIDKAEPLIKETDLILLQLEIPYHTIQHICKMAARHQKRIILNPAPARELDKDVLRSLEYLVLNETEAEIITGQKVTDDNMETVCRAILEMGPGHIILTLGSRGSYIFDKKVRQRVAGFAVKAVDSTAAGDTFCGAFAVSILSGNRDIVGAVRFANAAGALSVTRQGAQTSIPEVTEIEQLLASQHHGP
jgi:ribokinase